MRLAMKFRSASGAFASDLAAWLTRTAPNPDIASVRRKNAETWKNWEFLANLPLKIIGKNLATGAKDGKNARFWPPSSGGVGMRFAFDPQRRLDCPPIEEVKLNLNCRDEIIPILRALQHLYSDAQRR